MKRFINQIAGSPSIKFWVIKEDDLYTQVGDKKIENVLLAKKEEVEVLYDKKYDYIKIKTTSATEITEEIIEDLWSIRRLIDGYEERKMQLFKNKIEKAIGEEVDIDIYNDNAVYTIDIGLRAYYEPSKKKNKIYILDETRNDSQIDYELDDVNQAIEIIKGIMEG